MRVVPVVLTVVVLAASALLGSCAAREGAPDVTYRTFVRAVADRDGDRAWGLLSADTQAWLEARAQAAAAAAPGVVVPSGRQLLLGSAVRLGRPITGTVVLRESRDRAIVEVQEEGGEKREVELVRDKGWRVRIQPPADG